MRKSDIDSFNLKHKLPEIYQQSKPVKGISSVHEVQIVDGVVETQQYHGETDQETTDDANAILPILSLENSSSHNLSPENVPTEKNVSINDYIAVHVENSWYPAIVISVDRGINVNYMNWIDPKKGTVEFTDESCLIQENDVLQILPAPNMCSSTRNRYCFETPLLDDIDQILAEKL